MEKRDEEKPEWYCQCDFYQCQIFETLQGAFWRLAYHKKKPNVITQKGGVQECVFRSLRHPQISEEIRKLLPRK